MSDIPSVANLIPNYEVLEGEKVPIEKLFNIPITVTGWHVGPSTKKKGTNCLTLQFVRDGEEDKHVVFTGSDVLMDQLREIEAILDERGLQHKFKCRIVKIRDYFRFVSEA